MYQTLSISLNSRIFRRSNIAERFCTTNAIVEADKLNDQFNLYPLSVLFPLSNAALEDVQSSRNHMCTHMCIEIEVNIFNTVLFLILILEIVIIYYF